MRRVLLLTMLTILFLFFATAECAEWKLFAYNKHNSPYYWDNETVNYLSNNHVRIYIKTIPTAEQKVDQIKWYVAMKEKNKDFQGFFSHQIESESKTIYSLDLLEIHCIEQTMMTLSRALYDEKDNLLEEISIESLGRHGISKEKLAEAGLQIGSWNHIKPETVYIKLHKTVCKQKGKP